MEKDDDAPAGPVLQQECMCPLCLEDYQADSESFIEKTSELVPCPDEIRDNIERLFSEAAAKRRLG